MSSTQKKVVGNMGVIEHPTTTTIEGPGGRAIQVTGTKVTIPATWSPSGRPRQPTTTTTTTQSDDDPSSSATTSRKPANTGTSTYRTPCHHQREPSLSPSQARQSRESLRSMPASTRRLLDEAARWVPDCAKPRKRLTPTREQYWCPICCEGQTPPPWAEAPKAKPRSKFERKVEEREVYDQDELDYEWRREDNVDWTDVWYDDT